MGLSVLDAAVANRVELRPHYPLQGVVGQMSGMKPEHVSLYAAWGSVVGAGGPHSSAARLSLEIGAFHCEYK